MDDHHVVFSLTKGASAAIRAWKCPEIHIPYPSKRVNQGLVGIGV